MHRITENPCAITVAAAVPATPVFNFVIKRISRRIFKSEEMIRNTKGINEFPIALSIPAQRLYAKRIPQKLPTSEIQDMDSSIIEDGVFKTFKIGRKQKNPAIVSKREIIVTIKIEAAIERLR